MLFALVNGLVVVNACLHDPKIGADSDAYLAYIETLSQGRLPGPRDSYQYLSPPLPFVFASGARAATRWLGLDDDAGRPLAWQAGQLANVAWSLLLTWCLLDLGRRARPEGIGVRLASLFFLGLLPVTQQAFSGLRAEGVVASLGVASACVALAALDEGKPRAARFVGLGALLGLLGLSRQWGLAVVGALAVFLALEAILRPLQRGAILRGLVLGLGVAALVAGPFYAHLVTRYGSIAPHQGIAQVPHARRLDFSWRNQPASFWFGLETQKLLTEPVHPSLANRLLPTLHSSLWGDYWGCWSIASRDLRDGSYIEYWRYLNRRRLPGSEDFLWTNADRMVPYLGRTNAVALLPSGLLVAALGAGVVASVRSTLRRDASPRATTDRACAAVVVASLVVYLYFLVVTPDRSGTPIKAIYLLHAFPFWALLVAGFLERVGARSRVAQGVLGAGLLVVLVQEAPLLVTRFAQWP